MARKLTERAIAINHAWHDKNKERMKELQMKRYKENPEPFARRARKSALKAKFGITIEDYEGMARVRKGRCDTCKRKPKLTLHVDHCHKTGVVRGLLCNKCNMGIGLLNDDAKLIKAALEYLNHASR